MEILGTDVVSMFMEARNKIIFLELKFIGCLLQYFIYVFIVYQIFKFFNYSTKLDLQLDRLDHKTP